MWSEPDKRHENWRWSSGSGLFTIYVFEVRSHFMWMWEEYDDHPDGAYPLDAINLEAAKKEALRRAFLLFSPFVKELELAVNAIS